MRGRVFMVSMGRIWPLTLSGRRKPAAKEERLGAGRPGPPEEDIGKCAECREGGNDCDTTCDAAADKAESYREETFTPIQVENAVKVFLEFGETSYVPEDQPRGVGHYGYFSGQGWAARALRYHLKQLRESKAEKAGEEPQPVNFEDGGFGIPGGGFGIPTRETDREKTINCMVGSFAHHSDAVWRSSAFQAIVLPGMSRVFDHHIAPILKELDRTKAEAKIGNEIYNRLKGYPANLPVVTHLFDKPLEYWQDLDAELHETQKAHVAATDLIAELERKVGQMSRLLLTFDSETVRERDRITDKLKLKPGTPIEVVLDTIQSLQLHAERYRDVAVYGGKADLLAENHSLKEQMKLIGAALKRAGIEYPKGAWHVGVTDLASKSKDGSLLIEQQRQDVADLVGHLDTATGKNAILRGTIDSVVRNLGIPNPDEATREQIMDAISALQEQERIAKEFMTSLLKVVDALQILSIAEGRNAEGLGKLACEEISRLHRGQMQGRYWELLQEHAVVKQKLTTLRNIVQRKAPHTMDCLQSADRISHACGCWKAEFMAEADKP